jgi:hypothetical protein
VRIIVATFWYHGLMLAILDGPIFGSVICGDSDSDSDSDSWFHFREWFREPMRRTTLATLELESTQKTKRTIVSMPNSLNENLFDRILCFSIMRDSSPT